MSSRFIDICKKLREIQPYKFEVVCNDYLKARYPNLTPWQSTNIPRTIAGTPDAFLIDDNGWLIACQYGSTDKWRSKMLSKSDKEPGDAKKVADLAREKGIKVGQLIFCTTAALKPWEKINAEGEAKQRFGFPVEICDLRRLAHDLEELYPGICARRLGLPILLEHFMTLDEYFDSPNPRYWPKLTDLDEKLLYSPEEYIEWIREQLLSEGSCLLAGESGTGKSVLSLAFSLEWREKHPDAAIFYLDAERDRSAETGEDWYRQILKYDYQNSLYIIDNCHLAVAAINAFCRQWERQPASKARLILISRPRSKASEWEDYPEDYFDGFEDSGGVLPVKPESIYRGILDAYSETYQLRDKADYVSVRDELEDAAIAAKLEKLCSHNLVFAQYLLESWGETGGRLSEITEEKVFDRLSQRYLTRNKDKALPQLCALAQFEILAHGEFIHRHLPLDQVEALLSEKLLYVEDTPFYGQCYRLALHPQNAALIFFADVKRRKGESFGARVNDELYSTLKHYLASQPENFTQVYQMLYRSKNADLQNQLLCDAVLQASAIQQFETCAPNDIAFYLYALSQINSQRAKELLENFDSHISIDAWRKRIEALEGTLFTVTAFYYVRVNRKVAQKLFDGFDPKVIARRISSARFGSINRWIILSTNSLAAQLGYTAMWQREVAESLDISKLALSAQQGGLQNLFWFIRALKSIAPAQAKALLETFQPKDLAKKMSQGDLGSVRGLFQYLEELGFDRKYRCSIAESLDISKLALRAQQQSLQHLSWLIRALKSIAPAQAKALLEAFSPKDLAEKMSQGDLGSIEHIFQCLDELDFDAAFNSHVAASLDLSALSTKAKKGSFQKLYWIMRSLWAIAPKQAMNLENSLIPKEMAEMVRNKQGTVKNLDHLLQSFSTGFTQQLLGQFQPCEILDIFKRSKLKNIGSLLQNYYKLFSAEYAVFVDQHLPAKLTEAALQDMDKFIARIKHVPNKGEQLAQKVLELLLPVDLTERVAAGDVKETAGLLYSIFTVDADFSMFLLNRPGIADAITKGLTHSGLWGIQLLVHNLAQIAPELLPRIRDALRILEISDRLAKAKIKDISLFLWNIYDHIDQGLAREYCRIVDAQEYQAQIRQAPLNEIGGFLWNLVHISGMDIQMLNEPLLLKRLHAQWSQDFPQCISILGIMAITHPHTACGLKFPAIAFAQASEEITKWLEQAVEEERPYLFTMTLKGLSAFNGKWFNKIITSIQYNLKLKHKCLTLLQDAETNAVTERSQMLLKEFLPNFA